MSILNKAYFYEEAAAIEKLESIIWPTGPVCPHCGSVDKIYSLTGRTTRSGLRKCGNCRKQFTVKVGTVFESSHVPLHKWFQAVYLMASSKKGISAHQLHRMLEVTYKTAWFMAHRIREAMRLGAVHVFGNDGSPIEVDETFIGNSRTMKLKHDKKAKGRGYARKHKVLTLVDRASGKAQSTVMDDLKGSFSIFKRGMKGGYQHCAKKHPCRYLAKFDFRYNGRTLNDVDRAGFAFGDSVGKRLTYRPTSLP